MRHAGMSRNLEIYTIYHNPSDYLGHYVTRRTVIHTRGELAGQIIPDTEPTTVCKTMKEARQAPMDKGLTCLERTPYDEPCIVEVWL